MPIRRIPDASVEEQRLLFGPMDRNLRAVRERFGVRISVRRGTLLLESEDDEALQSVAGRVQRVLQRLRQGERLVEADVADALLEGVTNGTPRPPRAGRGGEPSPRAEGRVRPAGRASAGRRAAPPEETRAITPRQEQYVQSIRRHDVVLSVGPAGTGKTYLAVAEAVRSLRRDATQKIVLTRPAVEAGEKLGFLPGDFQAKINPYLRPLYDALGELLPYGEVKRYVDADVIEIVPLAYMRGRTLKQAFIILDEAQNTTPAQMKMFLTRMGMGSKVVVNGDVTQVDLPDGSPSGLVQAVEVLDKVEGVGIVRFTGADIIRHPLVQRIVDAYEKEPPRSPPPPGGA